MRISRAIGFQTLTTSIMFALLVATVTFYWVRLDSAQARIRDDALALRDYRLLSEVVNSWLLSGDLVFASDQTEMLAGGIRQGEQIYNLATELSQESLSQAYQNDFFNIIAMVENHQTLLLHAQQAEREQFQDLFPIWDASSQEVVSRVVELGELLISASQENGRIAAEERRMFITLIAIACAIFSLLIFMLWRWATRQIVQPLRQLTEAAHQALQLGTAMTVEKSHVDEIETLSGSINDFTKSLSNRVEERTLQLRQQQQHLMEEVDLRKAAQKVAQEAAVKATAASDAKSQFMANMSHEIRTPLNGIIGSAQLLGIMELEESAQDWVHTIEDSGEHLLSLVNAVLDFSKIDDGQFNLSCENFLTDTLLRQCRSTFTAHSVKNNIGFYFDIDPELPEQLIGDSLRIQQILTNLIGNAIKFTEAGSIEVRVKAIKINAESIRLNWEISDTGIGIPEDSYQCIFESFDQVDNSDSRKYGGSGLGLTISRELARMMGGDITVESKIGVGSTFHCVMILGLTEVAHLKEHIFDTSSVDLLAHNA